MTIGYTVSEAWKNATIYVKKPSAGFVPAIAAWIKVAGAWRPILMNAFTLTASGYNWNAYTAFVQKYGREPPPGATIEITVPAGQAVVGRAANKYAFATAAISTQGLPLNSVVTVHVYGTVMGSAGAPGFPTEAFPPPIAPGAGYATSQFSVQDREARPDRLLVFGTNGDANVTFAPLPWSTDPGRLKMVVTAPPHGKDGGPAIHSQFPITVKVYPGHFIAGGGGGGGGIGHARILDVRRVPRRVEWDYAGAYVPFYEQNKNAWKNGGGAHVALDHDNITNVHNHAKETIFVGLPGTFGAGGLPLDAPGSGSTVDDVADYCSGYTPPPQPQTEGPQAGMSAAARYFSPPDAVPYQTAPPGYRHGCALTLLYLGDSDYYRQYTYGDCEVIKPAGTYFQDLLEASTNLGGASPYVASTAYGYRYTSKVMLDTQRSGLVFTDPGVLGNQGAGRYPIDGPGNDYGDVTFNTLSALAYVEDTAASGRVAAKHKVACGTGGWFGQPGTDQSASVYGFRGDAGNGVGQVAGETEINDMVGYPTVKGGRYGYGVVATLRNGSVLRAATAGADMELLDPLMPGLPLASLRAYLMSLPVSDNTQYQRAYPMPTVPYESRRASRVYDYTNTDIISSVTTEASGKLAGAVWLDEVLEDRTTFVFPSTSFDHFPLLLDADLTEYTGATPFFPVQPCHMGKPGAAGKAIDCPGVTVDESAAPLNAAGAVG